MKNKVSERVITLSIALTSFIMVILLWRLWDYDMRVPLTYVDGDGISVDMLAKRLMGSEGLFTTKRLGAPWYGLNIDFPIYGDFLNVLALKILVNVFQDIGIGINLFHILSTILLAVISYVVMRKLSVSRLFSYLGALTFTFIPYKVIRLRGHYFLSFCTWIPLVVLVLFWFIEDDRFLELNKTFFKYKRNYIAIITLLIVSSTGIYYAFFTAFFIAVAILIKIGKKITRKVFCKGGILYASLLLPLFISSSCIKIMQLSYGVNPDSPTRAHRESEFYAMKIAQLFIPVKSHNIPALEKLINLYSQAPLPNENTEYLGILGIFGFLFLLIVLFYNIRIDKDRLSILSKFNFAALLLGTIGGFGSLFALIVTPQIRAYNRISVFIAFFSVLAACLGLTVLTRKPFFNKKWSMVFITILVCGALYEQLLIIKTPHDLSAFYSDKNFVESIEKQVPEGAMIYQMPYFSYPEAVPQNNVSGYAMCRGFLHSKTLRWSYGDQRGREGDLINHELSTLPIPELIDKLIYIGFQGIYIDINAYTPDSLKVLKEDIEKILNTEPMVSQNERLIFYNLKDRIEEIKEKTSEKEWVKNSFLFLYRNGFFTKEFYEGQSWRWCGRSGELVLYNFTNKSYDLMLSIPVTTGYKEESNLTVNVGDTNKTFVINSDGTYVNFSMNCKPGKNSIFFETDSKKVETETDSRELYMRFWDWKLEMK